LERFPDIKSLAKTNKEEIMKLWEGLGYYRRAENLHKTARIISNEYKGKFPGSYKELLKLPGIGPYTAAAIASFAFNEAVPVVDGNVFRVLARLTDSPLPVDTPEGKKFFYKLAGNFLDKDKPALHNQAVMEFGALQCTPGNPNCSICPLQTHCAAYNKNTVHLLPVKSSRRPVRIRFFNYFICTGQEKINLRKRTENDIWRNLYEFPLVETGKNASKFPESETVRKKFGIEGPVRLAEETVHNLTHQRLIIRFWVCNSLASRFESVDLKQITKYSLPAPLKKFLVDKGIIPNFGL
jgi:A/G-specific adenine glycosylase